MRSPRRFPLFILVGTALIGSGCGGGGSSASGGTGGAGGNTPPPSTANEWTWTSGSNLTDAVGNYGAQGVASASNVPGARSDAVSWTDTSGNLWLFGGSGYDSAGSNGALSDLWEFSPTTKEWTWVSGSDAANAVGIYGTQGVASTGNTPGGRDSAVGWTDKNGDFWLYGGFGYSATSSSSDLNDLWEFNPSTREWTWVSGSDTINAVGIYGTPGVASASNVPGARIGSVRWIDSSGNLWLFGGSGLDSKGTPGDLNDLWEFSPTAKTWTWVGGSETANAYGVYGSQGVASPGNTPGGRDSSVSWTDSSGNLWLYGGLGYSATSNGYYLSDLWEFNPSTKEWTWVNGSTAGTVAPVYGAQGIAAATNTPGSRDSAVGWTDSSDDLWLFGGCCAADYLFNDLWEFNPSTKEWTWVSGSNSTRAKGVYGTLGVAAPDNVPGSRGGSVSWMDTSGNLWLFGGEGADSVGSGGVLNDLWRYQP